MYCKLYHNDSDSVYSQFYQKLSLKSEHFSWKFVQKFTCSPYNVIRDIAISEFNKFPRNFELLHCNAKNETFFKDDSLVIFSVKNNSNIGNDFILLIHSLQHELHVCILFKKSQCTWWNIHAWSIIVHDLMKYNITKFILMVDQHSMLKWAKSWSFGC